MEIKILNNCGMINSIALKNNLVLEISSHKSSYEKINELKLHIFDLNKNKKTAVTNNIKKYDIFNICDCIWDSSYLFYITFDIICQNNVNFKIHRYNYLTSLDEVIYSFFDDMTLYPDDKKTSIFVLDENNIIIQFCRPESFELELYNIREDQKYQILDENLVKNGISTMIPISDNSCIVKTGYSRFNEEENKCNKSEISVESIFIVNINHLISEIILMKNNIQIEMMEQCFMTKSISKIKKSGKYLVYSIIDSENNEEKVSFIDMDGEENYFCINPNVSEISQLSKTFVIDDIPYIKLDSEKGTEFFNIIKSKVDIRVPFGMEYKRVLNNIIVASGYSVSKFTKKKKPFFALYKYPSMNVILKEKGEFIKGFDLNDNIYIFVR